MKPLCVDGTGLPVFCSLQQMTKVVSTGSRRRGNWFLRKIHPAANLAQTKASCSRKSVLAEPVHPLLPPRTAEKKGDNLRGLTVVFFVQEKSTIRKLRNPPRPKKKSGRQSSHEAAGEDILSVKHTGWASCFSPAGFSWPAVGPEGPPLRQFRMAPASLVLATA